jgi:SHS2 domain-containing protein
VQAESATPSDSPGHADTTPRWEHFAHGADIGVRGIGARLSEAFEQAALALTAVVTDPRSVAPRRQVEIHCEAEDTEALLADWLNEIVYAMATRHMLFARFQVSVDATKLDARAWGEPIDPARHRLGVEVKGATYTELRVARRGGAWLAQCVVDV